MQKQSWATLPGEPLACVKYKPAPPQLWLCYQGLQECERAACKVSWGNFGNGVTPGILHLECCSFLERYKLLTPTAGYTIPMVCLICRHGHPITTSSRTSAEESCTYNYSKTLQKMFSLKLIRSQANTTALLTIYQLSNVRPARTEILA